MRYVTYHIRKKNFILVFWYLEESVILADFIVRDYSCWVSQWIDSLLCAWKKGIIVTFHYSVRRFFINHIHAKNIFDFEKKAFFKKVILEPIFAYGDVTFLTAVFPLSEIYLLDINSWWNIVHLLDIMDWLKFMSTRPCDWKWVS